MWQAYGGFSFAFQPYIDANILEQIDKPMAMDGLRMIDPLTFPDTLAKIPKHVIVSSSDEFMMMDQTNIWYDRFTGETHLLIAPNAEHSLVTNIHRVLSSATVMIKSIAAGHTREQRPYITYKYNNVTGDLSVKIPDQWETTGVWLRHAETMSNVRRDFRFVRKEENYTEPCTLPWFKIPFGKNVDGGDCV